MSERGRGPEPLNDDLGGDAAAEQPSSAEFSLPPPAPRPIAPYDPYRPSDAAARAARRPVAVQGVESFRRAPGADPGPFLPDDDPLNADAWQLELGEIDESAEPLDLVDVESTREPLPAPRPARRQTASARPRREGGAGAGRAPRRARSASQPRQRPTITLTTPRVISGASLFTDQTMLALLAINVVSFLAMALLLGVRLGGLPAAIVLRLDAAGNPALWGPPSVLWRLPLMSLFITAMFLAFAWFFHPSDRFAARFALAASGVAQIVAWAAIILHVV